jgi:predicted anti-sigma-YlaC factor YlaD
MNTGNEFLGCACPEYEVFLEDYLDGALEGASARKVTEHLRSCVGCSQALADASAAAQWLHGSITASEPTPAFARIVMARIRAEEEKQHPASFWEPFVSLAWKFATTAALALVVMLAYASHGNTSQASNTSVAAVTTANDLQDLLMPTSSVPVSRTELTQMVTESDSNNAER